jgi:hypothetical protein
MWDNWWIWTSCAMLGIGLIYFWAPVWKSLREAKFARIQREFHTRREWLEAKFVRLAASHAKPDSPRWEDCEFANDVSYVRHRLTGELSAFVAISVAMEDYPDAPHYSKGEVIGKMQLGTAVFRYAHGRWETDGRTILNLTPAEAVRCFQRDWKVVGQEYARHV